jgi:hypothetical protein
LEEKMTFKQRAEEIGSILSDRLDPHWQGYVEKCESALRSAYQEGRDSAFKDMKDRIHKFIEVK